MQPDAMTLFFISWDVGNQMGGMAWMRKLSCSTFKHLQMLSGTMLPAVELILPPA